MPDPRRRRRILPFFRLTLQLGDDLYAVIPLDLDPVVARKAFRLRQQTANRSVYDVRLTEHGPECDCREFGRRGKCKHVRALKGARLLD